MKDGSEHSPAARLPCSSVLGSRWPIPRTVVPARSLRQSADPVRQREGAEWPLRKAPGAALLLEEPDEQQDDHDQRQKSATDVHVHPPWLLSGQQRTSPESGYALARMGARGDVAEWLGRGLQSLVQRFESARRLFGRCPQGSRLEVWRVPKARLPGRASRLVRPSPSSRSRRARPRPRCRGSRSAP